MHIITSMKKGFFAYSNTLPKIGKTIEKFIREINDGGITEILSWKNLSSSGRLIPREVLNGIEEADYLCADLTTLSDNVFFEIGFAIAKNKAIWLILQDSNIGAKKRLEQLGLFNTIGHDTFKSEKDLVKIFYDNNIYEGKKNIIDETIELKGAIRDNRPLLFLRNSEVNSSETSHIFNSLRIHKLNSYILDDAIENEVNTLTWYIESILRVPAVLIQFSPENSLKRYVHNLKCAFVGGLAVGLGLEMKFIAPYPYTGFSHKNPF